MDQGQINVKPEVGHEISIEDLEIYTKNRINMPSLVNSDEEISSDDDNETENEQENQNDLDQNCANKLNEALYSINIYITDIRIRTEIKNILNTPDWSSNKPLNKIWIQSVIETMKKKLKDVPVK